MKHKHTDRTGPYQTLLEKIGALYDSVRGSTLVETNRNTLAMHWEIGGLIEAAAVSEEKFQGSSYGSGLIGRLSTDLNGRFGKGFSRTNLRNMRRFHNEYALDRVSSKLGWTHYRELLSVADRRVRRRLEQRAIREGLSNPALQRLVRAEAVSQQESEQEIDPYCLSRPAGRLHCYKVVSDIRRGKRKFLLDCGFKVTRAVDLNGVARPRVGETVCSVKTEAGYAFKKVEKGRQLRYAYPAYLDRVIDGDTLLVQVDLGFGTLTEQRLRLRGLDAAEKGTREGQKAAAYLASRLERVHLVAIKTYGWDAYFRYLADVLYRPRSRNGQTILDQGRFLNQELLDAGVVAPAR